MSLNKEISFQEEQNRCAVCSEAVRRTLATMLDLSLLKSPSFMLLATSGFLTMMGFFVPFMFMKDRAVKGKMDESTAAFTVAAIGIANTIARIVCGILSSFKGVNALYLNNIAITLGGIATMMSGLWMNEAYQFTFAAIFGVAIGECEPISTVSKSNQSYNPKMYFLSLLLGATISHRCRFDGLGEIDKRFRYSYVIPRSGCRDGWSDCR